ncbi:hypothetical protein C0991_007024, partial [Blastosporella zonata]
MEEIGSDLYVTENDKIIDHTFPVSRDLIDDVYNTMVSSQYYDPANRKWRYQDLSTQKWYDLPQQSKKESTFYASLVYLCEAIGEAYRSQNHKAGVDTEKFESKWVMSPNNAPKSTEEMSPNNPPKSTEETASLILPDVFLLCGMEGDANEWKKKFDKLQKDET